VDLRTSQSDSGSSLLADKKAQEISSEGKVTIFLEDDADVGRNADIVLLDSSGQVIGSLNTTIGD
jgi:hypothetical protein